MFGGLVCGTDSNPVVILIQVLIIATIICILSVFDWLIVPPSDSTPRYLTVPVIFKILRVYWHGIWYWCSPVVILIQFLINSYHYLLFICLWLVDCAYIRLNLEVPSCPSDFQDCGWVSTWYLVLIAASGNPYPGPHSIATIICFWLVDCAYNRLDLEVPNLPSNFQDFGCVWRWEALIMNQVCKLTWLLIREM